MIYILWIKYINNKIYQYNENKIMFWLNDKTNLFNNLDDIYLYINGRDRILL